MAEYIKREDVIKALGEKSMNWNDTPEEIQSVLDWECYVDAIEAIPSADVVARSVYEQTVWERDIAIKQLQEDYGVGLGEKKSANIAEVKHGKWFGTVCSQCGNSTSYYYDCDYCPNCGARMDKGE